MSGPRRRPMQRLGELIPETARRLGLEEELAGARAIATWNAIIAERLPSAARQCRAVRLKGTTLFVETDAPIIAQEIHLRMTELLDALAATPAGSGVRELRIGVRRV